MLVSLWQTLLTEWIAARTETAAHRPTKVRSAADGLSTVRLFDLRGGRNPAAMAGIESGAARSRDMRL
jgi:hypothetical protein